ncbi:MAG: hypothetical protein OXK80_00980 [Bdellovibrionales bacterium]|nr:hypothetical protein [Bdellovibrionales bacterium]
MSTNKKRINLTVDHRLYADLERLRKFRKSSSLSAVVVDLTKEALELQEDIYFAEIAEKRRNEPTISHGVLWKK